MTTPLKLSNLRWLAIRARDAALTDAAQETLDTHNASEKADIALAQAYPTAETFIALLDLIQEARTAMVEVQMSPAWLRLSPEARDMINVALLRSRP
ncbi:hypothetical protein CcrColossus_gp401 [Caulobacter phage CcrColossus]|uniref:Uncharacterized protein n=1 Tax=Caulobacter phage CcrColossus TaxID=1211640 RepID=K4JT03_9CAUD|nr:hypothetical protein CcrColossus_gp401 [Caulobacter phage CcrColossus]AFU88271.1 hypothetical protein CcrColossus_gp401 [Caulobacter phage CcrColossus]